MQICANRLRPDMEEVYVELYHLMLDELFCPYKMHELICKLIAFGFRLFV